MCGVCARLPVWNHLGDVIISNRVYRYDDGEIAVHIDISQRMSDIMTYQFPSACKQLEKHHDVIHHRPILEIKPCIRDDQERLVLNELLDAREPLASPDHSAPCPDWSTVLTELWNGGLVVTNARQVTQQGRTKRPWRRSANLPNTV